ncbi:MAG: fibronectin type III-like domain-contianing protein, partial [Microbacterium sp.]
SADGSVAVSIHLGNAGDRDGVEVVQLYLHDPVASTVRPVQRLIAYARVPLAAGERVRVTFEVPADLASFTGADGRRVVEPGDIVLGFGRSSAEIVATRTVRITGAPRHVDHTRALHAAVTVTPDA